MSTLGNKCAPVRAYGGWREGEHEPLLNEHGDPVHLRGVPMHMSGGSRHIVCICKNCGCLYLLKREE
jgi:hypothetical protein